MNTLTVIKDENRRLVFAEELFEAIRQDTPADMDRYDKKCLFLKWLADRITLFEMEEGLDFFICLNMESIRQMLRYESAPEEVRRFFENYEQYA